MSTFSLPEYDEPPVVEFVSGYTMTGDPKPILRFMGENRFLQPVLSMLRDQLQAHFKGSELAVQLDVDEESGAEELAVEVHTDLTPQEAAHAFDEFETHWWLDHMDEAKCKMYITLNRR